MRNPRLALSGLLLLVAPALADPPPAADVELKTVKLDALKRALAAAPGKLVLVDVWANFCVPCKKEFPHLVDLHRRFAGRGLVCVSVCVDDPADRAPALKFLQKRGATFANYLLDEPADAWQDYWNITAIPAAFLYRDGKQVARFDYDDPDNQFTYADVEKAVARLLKTK